MPTYQAKLDQFMSQLLHDMGAAATGALVLIGDKLGGRQKGSGVESIRLPTPFRSTTPDPFPLDSFPLLVKPPTDRTQKIIADRYDVAD